MLFWTDYYLRWWRLPIEERDCRKTDLGGGDYYLRNSGLPPSSHIKLDRVTLNKKNYLKKCESFYQSVLADNTRFFQFSLRFWRQSLKII